MVRFSGKMGVKSVGKTASGVSGRGGMAIPRSKGIVKARQSTKDAVSNVRNRTKGRGSRIG